MYAESDSEALALEQSLKRFVNEQRERGVAVTASKLNTLLDRYGSNPLITNFLR